jgi:hypothetical protein
MTIIMILLGQKHLVELLQPHKQRLSKMKMMIAPIHHQNQNSIKKHKQIIRMGIQQIQIHRIQTIAATMRQIPIETFVEA